MDKLDPANPASSRARSVDQLGYVVESIEQSATEWVKRLGVGPFFFWENLVYPEFTYRGERQVLVTSLAFSYLGDVQIELIEQLNDARSVYADFKRRSGTGLVHIGQYVDDPAAAAAPIEARGGRLIQYGRDREGLEIMYFEAATHNGAYFELIGSNAARAARRARMKEAVRSWDGSTDPFRKMLDV
jgi:hypothetical protein